MELEALLTLGDNMAIMTAGLYRVEHIHQYLGQDCVNVYWYRHTTDADDKAFQLATAFDASLGTAIATVQNTGVTYSSIRATPIFGTGVEQEIQPTVLVGLASGNDMPTYVAASIRLNRTTNELRNGWKRYTGCIEQNMGASSFAGGFVTDLNTLAGLLNNQIVDSGETFTPQIVRKPFSTKAMNNFWEAIDVGTTLVLNRPTTQSSRKEF